ncbi:PfkB family carbohydrate kinase [Peteryoungia algae]|uniref:PfkB family carbohydrate kinase n=1 Tax=Peteryoungia algae TaxID=2919917 RepID=A0ABT0CY07_9HYPH|nr:PfkB family carbohydrate kinase [Rhizobium sp. SSM4.3]MCJ8238041.1 PfkB family carbohydrate kinase [Rhizobium sp. SSM4.3]
MTDRRSTRVVVIGHINHDRIWRLTEPLRPGGRIAWSSRDTRLGGGGYFTAKRLLDFGHDVALLSNLMTDDHGETALADLEATGFDTSLIARREGATDFADILLDPTGDRTILSSERRLSRTFLLDKPVHADAFYVNAPKLPQTIVDSLERAPLVVSQLPIREGGPRPADVIVGSKADLPGMALADVWRVAAELGTKRLTHLVMTDGPDRISLFDGHLEQTLSLARTVSVPDTIGAGDTFSGALLHGLLEGRGIVEATRLAGDTTTDWLEQREQAAHVSAIEKSIS